jgi:hypothetical protein
VWLQHGEEADVQALERLLSPGGRLFAAMAAADADGLISFLFPLERLPTHTQLLLASDAGRCCNFCMAVPEPHSSLSLPALCLPFPCIRPMDAC